MARTVAQRLPSGRWRGGYQHSRSKKRVWVRGTFELKREALGAAQEELDSGLDRAGSQQGFAAFADEYFDNRKVADSTLNKELWHLEHTVLPFWEDYKLADITVRDVERWINQLSGEYGPWAQRDAYGVFSRIVRKAIEYRQVMYNPLPMRPQFDTLDDREEASYIDSLDDLFALADVIDPRFRALVLTMSLMGLRPAEAYGIRKRYLRIDTNDPGIKMAGSLKEVGNAAPYWTASTKSGKGVYQPVPMVLVEELRRHLFEHYVPNELGLIFTSPNGHPIRRGNFIRSFFKPAVEQAKLDADLSPYSLRHTANVILQRERISEKERAVYLRHSERTNSQFYSHVSGDRMRELTLLIDSACTERVLKTNVVDLRQRSKRAQR